MDTNIISQVDLLLKGHGNYECIYNCKFTMVTDLNRNNQSGADMSCHISVVSLILKNIFTLPGGNQYAAGK